MTRWAYLAIFFLCIGWHVGLSAESFPLVTAEKRAAILVDPTEDTVVHLAARAFRDDVKAVTGVELRILGDTQHVASHMMIFGTHGRSRFLSEKVGENLTGKWESWHIDCGANALVVTGSDPRGTAYGIFSLSRKIGVSPWRWWADVRPEKRSELILKNPCESIGSPAVKYRGIFLNDEDWGLQPWAAQNIDTDIRDIGPKTYARIFELLLRLRANTIWPAMHPCTKAFFYYKDNPQMARDYAIVVGSSHCEQMLRNNVDEWKNNYKKEFGEKPGPWEILKNRNAIFKYWERRVAETADMEVMYTLGKRGIHDSGLPGVPQKDRKTTLEGIIRGQRELIAKYRGSPEKTPQVFCPYKEVLEIYREGLTVPEDVTLVWADDNHGWIRQLSNTKERQRSGGAGVYYHLSYWGPPEDYLWLSTTSPSHVYHEMRKAYLLGAKNIWIANVGDIKPAELEMEYFLDLAWNAQDTSRSDIRDYLERWYAFNFGAEYAETMARLRMEYYRLNSIRPEHLTYVRFEPEQVTRRLSDFQLLCERVDAVGAQLPERLQDAWFQLMVYPVKGSMLLNRKILCITDKVVSNAAYREIKALTQKYNQGIADGKWHKIMSDAPRGRPVFHAPEKVTFPKVRHAVVEPPILYQFTRCEPYIRAAFADSDYLKAPSEFIDIAVDTPTASLILRACPVQVPFAEGKLRVAVTVDGQAPRIVDIQTVDHSAQWNRAVLLGYNDFKINIPLSVGKHSIRLYFLDPGIYLRSIHAY